MQIGWYSFLNEYDIVFLYFKGIQVIYSPLILEQKLDQEGPKQQRLRWKIGYSFHVMVRILCIIFGFFALLFGFSNPLIGIPLLLFLSFLAFHSYGLEIEKNKNRFREYSSAMGFKIGKWQTLSDYPDIAILKTTKGYTVRSMSNRATTDTDPWFEIYLLSPSHRQKVLMRKFKSPEKARKFGENIAEKLGLNFTNYSPKLSIRSRQRR